MSIVNKVFMKIGQDAYKNWFRIVQRKKKNKISRNVTVDKRTKLGKCNTINTGSYIGAEFGNHSTTTGNCYLDYCLIGNFTSIGKNVSVVVGNHPIDHPSLSSFFYSKTDDFRQVLLTESNYACEIGNDVWIGNNVVIKGGVKIGDGAIIGFGSVVTKDVPSYAIVAGNPAKIIRYRFSAEQVEKLNELCWWNMSDEALLDNKGLFSLDIDEFLCEMNSLKKRR